MKITRHQRTSLPAALAAKPAKHLHPHRRPGLWLTCATLLAAQACALTGPDSEPETATTPRTYSDVSGAGPLNGVEWQVDAPWRMEPDPSAGSSYEPIPLVVSFMDMDMQSTEDGVVLPYGKFCGLYVMRNGPNTVTYIPPEDFHEMEASKRWLTTGYLTPVADDPATAGPDDHMLRRMWAGDSPDDVQILGDWAEWHGTAFYDPGPVDPGSDLNLLVMARVSKTYSCTPENPVQNSQDILWQQMEGRVADYPAADSTSFTEFLKVHYGEDPLPRFDQDWIYGDLHYHSQGTDNEGESGIHYRGVIQAMKAMGMDYVFATDHASNSDQVTGIDTVFVNDLPDFPWYLEFAEDWARGVLDDLEAGGIGFPINENDALRDLSPQRFAHLYHWLNDTNGVNAEVDASGGSSRRPQIFLGSEVDVIPEISDEEKNLGHFGYALTQRYWWSDACSDVPNLVTDYTDFEEGDCVADLAYPGSAPGQWAVRDVQGMGQIRHARQHMLHLPIPSDQAFIPSNTTEFGGADRWLSTIVDEELDQAQKGYAFLAHPVDAASGNGLGRLGPDIVPYSDTQLMTAFASEHILGLQLWNENSRQVTIPSDSAFPILHGEGYPDPEIPGYVAGVDFDWSWASQDETHLWSSLTHGAAMWDQVLRWGITPARTAAIGMAPDQPRKMFMAGGSDAHGDLNYRREGRFFGWAGANDTAIGKPRNLTHVSSDRLGIEGAVSQTQVLDALASGEFTVTDGPAMRIAIDVNGNGVIDDADVPMGGDFQVVGDTVPLLVEWKSTAEFGPVRAIDVYVGTQASTHEGVVYASQSHGPTGGAPCVESDLPFTDQTGQEYCPMQDGYVRDPTGELTLSLPLGDPQGYQGTHLFQIRPTDFPVFDYGCTTETEAIWVDDETGAHWEYVDIIDCDVTNVQTPQRLYTRAFVRTEGQGFFMRRFAFSNPIWMTVAQVSSAPIVDVTHQGCDSNVNTYSVSVSNGVVPGTITKQYKIGAGSWQTLTSDSFTAPGGNTVYARAQACNANGCSAYAQDWASGPTCNPPPPTAPLVTLEFAQCSYGTNYFVSSVTDTDPTNTTSMTKQFRIANGSWQTLTNALIQAGSSQSVSLRARACSVYGCSAYAQTTEPGPYCPVGGGGTNPF